MRQLTLTIFTIASFLLVSCNTSKENILTDQDKATIKSEVQAVINNIVANSEALNLEKATESYLNNPDFISISNGVIADYKSFLKGNKEYFNAIVSQTYTENDLIFTIIDKKTVILTFGGSALVTMKDQQKVKVDPFLATLVFRKIDDSWKVLYTNEFATFAPIENDSIINQ
ncbi:MULTISPECIES: nuclear transport factor 2 family protein [unclassified Polaribacter]|uniref:nuclear transport factor 2 family protein n=1 Tax=unclassified Polaribacter TaxID=196858 RepID=UPI0011BF711B|nr:MULTISPECIES: nuclear transport factor 2 family protein [unclassified Polaribacter]TXD51490.1 hypothetical protein ES043_11895 [Polaribacter sp. IC063]TXD61782.1 hypothetical protein ES044_03425 [Polaribacter sp. IC066]